MYLSQLILNPKDRRVQREIANPYELHRSLMQGFPDDLEPDNERVLFRLEPHRQDHQLILLVQSWNLPDWTWLAEPGARSYLAPTSLPNPAVKSFDLQLKADQVLAFRLRGNPTVKRDGKRFGLYHEDEQAEWIERKVNQSGCRLLSARTTRKEILNAVIPRPSATHEAKLLSVLFDGHLRVKDPERLFAAVRNGVGSAKAFGFGLLSLAPARG